MTGTEGPLVVALDPAVTVELRREGIAREIVNRIQRLRKEAGYDYNTRIAVGLSGAPEVLEAAGAFEGFIARETLARRLVTGSDLGGPDISKTVDIEGKETVISLLQFDGAGDRRLG